VLDVETKVGQNRLVEALERAGLEAFVWESGGGMELVCATLLDVPGTFVAAAAGCAASPCDVGLISEPPEIAERIPWKRTPSLADAVARFLELKAIPLSEFTRLAG
jgi:hypothetical protein